MRPPLVNDQLAEIFVARNQHAAFRIGTRKNHWVAGVGAEIAHPNHIVA